MTAPSESLACWPKRTRSGSSLQRTGERVTRGDEIGARRALVGDEDDPVGTHRQGLAKRIERALGPERDEHDLGVCVVPLEAQRLFDGVCVERVQRLLAGAVEAFRRRID